MVMRALNIAVAGARQKTWRVKKRTLVSGGARIKLPGGVRAKRASAKCKGIKPDESTDRPGNSGRADYFGFAGRRADADAAQPADQDTAARGRHEVATDRPCENLRHVRRRL